MKKECTHEDATPVLCTACKSYLRAHEIEVLGNFIEIGAFCENRACIKYLLLTLAD
jgi:hypothetical protein